MNMPKEYYIGPFSDVAGAWGNRLWEFLNEPENVRLMAGASNQGRPAAEAIADHLFVRFGDSVKKNRVKQFTGLLIRQVMERNGYRHSAYGRKADATHVFSKASLYTREANN